MSSPIEHPSFLELDRMKWDGASESVRQHVAGCEACTAHLGRVAPPVPVPAWARALEEERPRGWRALFVGGGRWAWGGAWAGALAVLALVLVPLLRPREVTPGPYVGVKGLPSVVVHVRHGQAVAPWDGTKPLTPGDSVRLEVAAPGYPHVLVGSRTPEGDVVTLYTGTLPESGALLPTSWRVDAEGEGEQLVVVLSRAPVAPAELPRVLSEHGHEPDVWVTELRLPKQPAP